MKIFQATATSDRGYVYTNEEIRAGSFRTAFSRAAQLAKTRGRSHLKQVTISLRYLGIALTPKANGSAYLIESEKATPARK